MATADHRGRSIRLALLDMYGQDAEVGAALIDMVDRLYAAPWPFDAEQLEWAPGGNELLSELDAIAARFGLSKFGREDARDIIHSWCLLRHAHGAKVTPAHLDMGMHDPFMVPEHERTVVVAWRPDRETRREAERRAMLLVRDALDAIEGAWGTEGWKVEDSRPARSDTCRMVVPAAAFRRDVHRDCHRV